MTKFAISTLLFFVLLPLHIALAETKTVTINWTASGPIEDIQSYTMVYSYTSNMANPINACSTEDNGVTTLTCEGVELNSNDVYFRIIATTTSHSTTESNIQHVTIPPPESSISIVREFQLSLPGASSPPSDGIFDTFSSDTTENYSFISGSMTIQNGAAHGQSWRRTIGYHTTSLGKSDQTVSATCSFMDRDYACVAARVTPSSQTGYFVSIAANDVTLHSFSGTSTHWVAEASGNFSSPAKVELAVTGNHFVVKVNDIVQIDSTNTTYSSGDYCGPVISRGMTDADITIDNFKGTAQ